MHKIAMLGTGLIGRFYTMGLQNFRGWKRFMMDISPTPSSMRATKPPGAKNGN